MKKFILAIVLQIPLFAMAGNMLPENNCSTAKNYTVLYQDDITYANQFKFDLEKFTQSYPKEIKDVENSLIALARTGISLTFSKKKQKEQVSVTTEYLNNIQTRGVLAYIEAMKRGVFWEEAIRARNAVIINEAESVTGKKIAKNKKSTKNSGSNTSDKIFSGDSW